MGVSQDVCDPPAGRVRPAQLRKLLLSKRQDEVTRQDSWCRVHLLEDEVEGHVHSVVYRHVDKQSALQGSYLFMSLWRGRRKRGPLKCTGVKRPPLSEYSIIHSPDLKFFVVHSLLTGRRAVRIASSRGHISVVWHVLRIPVQYMYSMKSF